MNTGNLRRQLRLLAFTVLVAGARIATNEVHLGALPLQCDTDICTSDSAPCDSECGIGWTMTTCSDYLSVYNGIGQCDEVSWNTCNYECGPNVSGSQTCLDWGVPSTCAAQGNYGPRCGNGICDGSDTPSNCSYDCGPVPEDPEEMADEIENEAPTFNTDDGSTLCNILAGMGIGYSFDCPGSDIWEYNTPTSQACSAKAATLAGYTEGINSMAVYYHLFILLSDWDSANIIWDIMYALQTARDTVQATPCYMFNL